jgi:plexin A
LYPNKQINFFSTDEKQALCRTSPASSLLKGHLKMQFDSGVRELKGIFFEYVDDPLIDYAYSGTSNKLKIPKGVPAGGIKITVVGKNFQHIQSPKMYVYYQQKMFLSQCEVKSNSEMVCDSPYIEAENSQLDPDRPSLLEYGFEMDDVTGVQNLTSKNKDKFHSFELYPNPEYLKFEEDVKYYKSEYLTINGRNLDRACKESDVIVRIGSGLCNITSLSRQQLTCRPPVEPHETDMPEVIVYIGNNLQFTIGVLSYASPTLISNLSRNAIIGASVGVVILLIVFIGLLIAYKKKTSESNRVLKNMQEQMDILELRVAAECKEAFAELQTEMTDLTSEYFLMLDFQSKTHILLNFHHQRNLFWRLQICYKFI